jgi:hypothetical protein
LAEGQDIKAQMDTKLFTLDKNYILKEAQIKVRTQLLRQLVSDAKSVYLDQHNPLGLIDDTILQINTNLNDDINYLNPFYYELAGIYRLKYGENQLEFLFDGSSHFIKYKKEWQRKFQKWMTEFLHHKHFVRAILEGSYLNPDKNIRNHVQIRLKLFLEQRFQLRVYKYRGIKKLKSA